MRSTRTTALLLTGALGLGAGVTGLVVAPAVAATTSSQAPAADVAPERVSRIADALSSLVDDGTLTQEQADRVATTLAEQLPGRGPGGGPGHGGRGHRLGAVLETAAGALGITVEELRTALAGGQSLAGVAEAQGVQRQALVDALVAAANARVDEHLAEGDITQEQADARRAEVAERVDALVDREGLPRRGDRGPKPPAEGDRD
jgi:polyhydroxyalkanoate synthesis regulator phasin